MQGGYFSEWLNSYRQYLRMRNYSSRTIQSYDQVVRMFAYYVWLKRNSEPGTFDTLWKDFSNARLDTDVQVEPVMMNDFLTYMNSVRAYKPKTLHRMMSTIRLVLPVPVYAGGNLHEPDARDPKAKDQGAGTPVPETQPGDQAD